MIGIEEVLDARTASAGSVSSAARKIAFLTSASSTTASISRSAGGDRLGRLDPREYLVGVGAALLGELDEAPAHGLEPTFDRGGLAVVQEDAPPGCGDDLRDPGPHLAGPHHEHRLERHAGRLVACVGFRGTPGACLKAGTNRAV